MSLLSDKSFIKRSILPTHFRHTPGANGFKAVEYLWEGHLHSSEEIAEMRKYMHCWPFDERDAEQYWKSLGQNGPMFSPFEPTSIKRGENDQRIASYGTSSYGYDIRAAAEFKVFRGFTSDGRIDYKNITDDMFETVEDDNIWIPPHGFILARSVEYVRVPRGYLALCIGKSTIARVGINCLCTPLEPEWEGYITLEFSNTTALANRFYANEGVLQLVFVKGDEDCKTSYADRGGKYNYQGKQIVLPTV